MCHDRGYLVTQDELDQTLDQFRDQFGDRPRLLIITKPNSGVCIQTCIIAGFKLTQERGQRGPFHFISTLVFHKLLFAHIPPAVNLPVPIYTPE